MFSTYCGKVNGGDCRNKVSPANDFTCSAGHSKSKSSFTSPAAAAPLQSGIFGAISNYIDSASSSVLLEEIKQSDWSIRAAVAQMPSIEDDLRKFLCSDRDARVLQAVARNPNLQEEEALLLAERNIVPHGFIMGKPIDELELYAKHINKWPNSFGPAYISRILEFPRDADEERGRDLVFLSYSKIKEAARPISLEWKVACIDKIKERYPADQEMAKMVGY